MFKRVFLIWVVTLIVSNFPLLGEVVQVSTVVYPPFTSDKPYKDIGQGQMADVTVAMFKRAGIQAELVFLPHRRSISSFIHGLYPFSLNSMKIFLTAGLKPEDFDSISLGFFSAHFFYLKSHLKNGLKYSKYSDLRGYSVCLTRGSYVLGKLKKAEVTVEEANTNLTCLKKIIHKRNDVWGSIDLTAYFLINQEHPEYLDDFAFAETPKNSFGGRDELVLSYLKTNQNAIEKAKVLREAFEQMKKDGTLISIMKRYWGDKIPKNVLPLDMQ